MIALRFRRPRWQWFTTGSTLSLALLLVVIALLFVPHWLQGDVFGTFDLGHLTIPIEDLYARYQRAGELPLWSQEFQAGYPLIANGLQSFWYLPHIVLRAFLPGFWIGNLSLLVHTWLAGIGMWWLLRQQAHTRPAAWLGAVLFAAGGYFVGRITVAHLVFPAAWIPLIVAAFFAWWQQPTWRRSSVFAALVATQIFSGHIQIVVYTAISIACVAAVLLLRQQGRGAATRIVPGICMLGLIVVLTAVHTVPVRELVSQTRRAEGLSMTEAFDVSYPLTHLITWVYPKAFGNQAAYAGAKNEPELMAYFGIVGLLLGIIGLLSPRLWKDALGQSAAVWLLLGLLLAMGGYSPLFRSLYRLPTIITQLSNPGRALIIVHLAWAVIAAYGLHSLMSEPLWSRRLRKVLIACGSSGIILASGLWWLPSTNRLAVMTNIWSVWVPLCIVLATALVVLTVSTRRWVVLAVLGLVVGELVWYGFSINPVVPRAAWTQPPRVMAQLESDPMAPRIYSHTTITPTEISEFKPAVGPVADARNRLQQSFIAQHDRLAGINVEFTWHTKPPQPGAMVLTLMNESGDVIRTSEANALLISNGDLIPFHFSPLEASAQKQLFFRVTAPWVGSSAPRWVIKGNPQPEDYNPTGQLEDCSDASCVPVISKDETTADATFQLRYADTPTYLDRELLLPVLGEGEGNAMIRGHLTLQLERMSRYLYEIGERGDFVQSKLVGRRHFFDRLSIGRLVASFDEHRGITAMPGLERLAAISLGDREVQLYRNQDAYPRLHFATAVVVKENASQVREALLAGEVPPAAVVIEQPPALPIDIGADQQAVAELIQDKQREIIVRTTSQSNQLLVLRDVIYPGWHARVDGQAVPMYYIDSLFRGVFVPAGEHQVTFGYYPMAFWRAAWVSAAAWVIVLIGLLVTSLLPQRPQRGHAIAH